jgi:hypothetical protein
MHFGDYAESRVVTFHVSANYVKWLKSGRRLEFGLPGISSNGK